MEREVARTVVSVTPLQQVREFHETFGLPIGDKPLLPDEGERDLRWDLLEEEFRELGGAEAQDDLVGIADALADMVCVIYGTALSYGIDLDAVLAEVHRSNMTKERHPTQEYPSKNVVKGASYSPPDIQALVA